MIDSAVGAGILDRASGCAYLSDAFLFKMQRLAWDYRDQRLLYDKVQAQAQLIREDRDKQSPFLARLIRNIHTSFNKFHKLGKVDKELMKHYQIPKGASRQPANRLKFWIRHGETIVRVHRKRKAAEIQMPPVYVLTDAVVEILARHVAQASKVLQALQRKVEANADEHIRLRQLREKVVDSLELVKRQLEFSLYKQPEAKRRLAFSAYGILFPDGKGQAYMMGMMKTSERRKEEPDPQPKAEAEPQQKAEPELRQTADSEPQPKAELQSIQEPQQKADPKPQQKVEPQVENERLTEERKLPQTTLERLETQLEKIKNSTKKVRGKTRKIRRLREQIEVERARQVGNDEQ